MQLLLTTVSNDEKPLSFLHSNISFGTLIHKQAFHTRLFRIFHPCILVPHFPVLHFLPLHFWPSCIFRLAFSVVPSSPLSLSSVESSRGNKYSAISTSEGLRQCLPWICLEKSWKNTALPYISVVDTSSPTRSSTDADKLTRRARLQLQISQGHQTWYHSIDWIWLPISVL